MFKKAILKTNEHKSLENYLTLPKHHLPRTKLSDLNRKACKKTKSGGNLTWLKSLELSLTACLTSTMMWPCCSLWSSTVQSRQTGIRHFRQKKLSGCRSWRLHKFCVVAETACDRKSIICTTRWSLGRSLILFLLTTISTRHVGHFNVPSAAPSAHRRCRRDCGCAWSKICVRHGRQYVWLHGSDLGERSDLLKRSLQIWQRRNCSSNTAVSTTIERPVCGLDSSSDAGPLALSVSILINLKTAPVLLHMHFTYTRFSYRS